MPGRRLNTADKGGVVKVWNLNSGMLLHVYGLMGAPVTCLAYRPAPSAQAAKRVRQRSAGVDL